MAYQMNPDDVFQHWGGARAISLEFGITVQSSYQWRNGIPKDREYEIFVRSNGAIRPSDDVKALILAIQRMSQKQNPRKAIA